MSRATAILSAIEAGLKHSPECATAATKAAERNPRSTPRLDPTCPWCAHILERTRP